MSDLEKIKLMINKEPTLTNIETDSLITKVELIMNQKKVNVMSSNDKIIAIINLFKNLAVKDQSLMIEVLQNTFNKDRMDKTIEAKEQLLKQQQEMQHQADF
jgi:Ni,Fe-hydrogenase I large subunit|tara:strand:+ start:61 stop:366 length:306 start_codon:yes stop_codon:yes gene_type:complete